MPAGIIPNVAFVTIVVVEVVIVVTAAVGTTAGVADKGVEILGGTVLPHTKDRGSLIPQKRRVGVKIVRQMTCGRGVELENPANTVQR